MCNLEVVMDSSVQPEPDVAAADMSSVSAMAANHHVTSVASTDSRLPAAAVNGDGHKWLKYGMKDIGNHVRCYYRCAWYKSPNACPARKTVNYGPAHTNTSRTTSSAHLPSTKVDGFDNCSGTLDAIVASAERPLPADTASSTPVCHSDPVCRPDTVRHSVSTCQGITVFTVYHHDHNHQERGPPPRRHKRQAARVEKAAAAAAATAGTEATEAAAIKLGKARTLPPRLAKILAEAQEEAASHDLSDTEEEAASHDPSHTPPHTSASPPLRAPAGALPHPSMVTPLHTSLHIHPHTPLHTSLHIHPHTPLHTSLHVHSQTSLDAHPHIPLHTSLDAHPHIPLHTSLHAHPHIPLHTSLHVPLQTPLHTSAHTPPHGPPLASPLVLPSVNSWDLRISLPSRRINVAEQQLLPAGPCVAADAAPSTEQREAEHRGQADKPQLLVMPSPVDTVLALARRCQRSSSSDGSLPHHEQQQQQQQQVHHPVFDVLGGGNSMSVQDFIE
ncbi:unnamed protein product [Closterium sp. Naga37s-1]|nr:unnamed protein product [Closterium sp. Naga37s-1]